MMLRSNNSGVQDRHKLFLRVSLGMLVSPSSYPFK